MARTEIREAGGRAANISVRPAGAFDAAWIVEELAREFHGPMIERGDEFIDARELPALVGELDGPRVGLLTLILHPDHGEIFSLSSSEEAQGVGSMVLTAAEALTRDVGKPEVRLFTINSNLKALGFYQRRGYRLWAVHATQSPEPGPAANPRFHSTTTQC